MYLGFIVNEKGYKPDAEKVEAIKKILPQQTVKEIRSIICMTGFYIRMIAHFSSIAESLIALTKKYAKFNWTPESQKSFADLKAGLTKIPFLGFPDRKKGYCLYTNASATLIGEVLCQKCDPTETVIPGIPNKRPIHFIFHILSPTMQKMSEIEREGFPLKFALDKLQIYVQESHVTCFVDHQLLRYVLTTNLTKKKLQAYALAISGYNVTIEYISIKKNRVADMLSRTRNDDDAVVMKIHYLVTWIKAKTLMRSYQPNLLPLMLMS